MMDIASVLQQQREYFLSGNTLLAESRKDALQRLLRALNDKETLLTDAVRADLNKSAGETYLTELGMVRSEIKFMLRNIDRWCRPQRAATPLSLLPGSSRIYQDPYGVVLIMGSWNYPLQLNLLPLVDALAAGNCVILKPSAYAPETSRALNEVLDSVFPQEHVCVIEGGRDVNTELLAQRYDLIFFTGSQSLGRTVMEAAARNLTPVVLELGGKCPAIVDATANLETAARRIVWGKLLNAGQTCVAPDYVFVHDSVEQDLISHMVTEIKNYLGGEDALEAEDYPAIVNEKHFDRLVSLLKGQRALCGGTWDRESRKISPTILTGIDMDSPIMQEEIFGPVLPVIPYRNIGRDVIKPLQKLPHPLALYFFSHNKDVTDRVLSELSFGGGCLNDTVMHLSNPNLPFGGVGASGMGAYHGRKGFETFSHMKSIYIAKDGKDNFLRRPPFDAKKLKLLRKLF